MMLSWQIKAVSWPAFTGAARRLSGGDFAIARNSTSNDTDSGTDFAAGYTRTMGALNLFQSLGPYAGHGDALDVRLRSTSGGITAIINAAVPTDYRLEFTIGVSVPEFLRGYYLGAVPAIV